MQPDPESASGTAIVSRPAGNWGRAHRGHRRRHRPTGSRRSAAERPAGPAHRQRARVRPRPAPRPGPGRSALRGLPVRNSRRADVPHRRPGELDRGGRTPLRRPGGRPGEDPRIPDRARGGRGGAARAPPDRPSADTRPAPGPPNRCRPPRRPRQPPRPAAAHAQGIPTAVYRPSRLCGHTATGDCGTDDALWNVVRAMAAVGAAPDRTGPDRESRSRPSTSCPSTTSPPPSSGCR